MEQDRHGLGLTEPMEARRTVYESCDGLLQGRRCSKNMSMLTNTPFPSHHKHTNTKRDRDRDMHIAIFNIV